MLCHYTLFWDPLTAVHQSNRAYATAENRIPAVRAHLPAAYHIALGHDPFQYDEHGPNYCNPSHSNVLPERLKVGRFDTRYETSMHRFTKDDLRHAEVISQVDRKFIACRIVRRSLVDSAMAPGEAPSKCTLEFSDSTLVLIDQHAADERVRVERFLKELCLAFLYSQEGETKQAGIRTTELIPPRPVLLTQHEAHSINGSQDVQEILRKWGVGFAELSKAAPDGPSESGISNAYSQLLVSSVPQVVGDKVCAHLFYVIVFSHFCIVNDFLFVRGIDSSFKETNCAISSRESLARFKTGSYSQIREAICILNRTKTNLCG